jgi:hypothetical protein
MLIAAYLLTFCNKNADRLTNALKLTTSDYLCTSSKLLV